MSGPAGRKKDAAAEPSQDKALQRHGIQALGFGIGDFIRGIGTSPAMSHLTMAKVDQGPFMVRSASGLYVQFPQAVAVPYEAHLLERNFFQRLLLPHCFAASDHPCQDFMLQHHKHHPPSLIFTFEFVFLQHQRFLVPQQGTRARVRRGGRGRGDP